MQCAQFEELISDYLDCGMARADRRRFCEHLLACRPCHETFNDVRRLLDDCADLRARDAGASSAMERRILDATRAGEMLSCRTLDALISDYFDGLIEAAYETVFNEHFAVCDGCRRLVEGVRQSIEAQETIEVPEDLYERIFAVTSKVAVGGARR